MLLQAFGGALTVRPYGRPANGAALGAATWLTEAGQALLPLCNNILEVAAEAVRAVSDLRQAHTGRVMLAASQTVGTYVMPRLLAAFRIRNPGVRRCCNEAPAHIPSHLACTVTVHAQPHCLHCSAHALHGCSCKGPAALSPCRRLVIGISPRANS